MGQIHDYAIRDQSLPAGWALDANGDPTIDARAAKSGSIAPFGQAKGYALGLAFEVLVGAITGSAVGPDVRGTLDSEHPCNKGDVFIVIDPGSDAGTARRIADYLDAVRASGGEGGPGVSIPGDRAMSCRRQRLQDGLPLAEEVWEKIRQLAAVGFH
jgi:LDH2 family malate/lactate/ureidoglycolate dehydrogenase